MIKQLKERRENSRWGGSAGNDAWLLVYFGVLIGLYTKFDFLLGRIDVGLRSPVVEHSLFPSFFLDGRVALVAYFLPLLACVGLWRPSVVGRQLAGIAVMLGSGMLLLHVEGYNDVTFTAGLWVGMWLLWWAGRAESAESPARYQAILFGKAIVGLFFLGGAVGKLTGE